MNPIAIIKAIFRKIHLIFLFPVIVAAIVFYMQLQKPKEYQSGMIFYTGITSGYNLSSQGDARVDNIAVNNAFDNLMTIIESRETLEEVSMRLLTTHLLLDGHDPFKISSANFNWINAELLPQSLLEELKKNNNYDSTLQRIKQKFNASKTNDIIRLIHTSRTFYDVDVIKRNLSVSRKRNSDMLEIIYRSSDPGVCLLTLQILAQTFIEKNQSLKNYEAGGIIDYFIAELENARVKLNTAEQNLKDYAQLNQVINYQEQTKYIAVAKEDLEKEIYQENARIDAFRQAISKLEQNLEASEKRYLNNTEILRMRNQIAEINSQIVGLELMNRPEDITKLNSLREQAAGVERDLIEQLNQYQALNYSTETLPRDRIINQWLANVLELEKSTAKIEVLVSHRSYFTNLFNQFAPIGFNLSKMEREIQIAEREYLTILHGLNMARLRQSNLELFGALELLDEPFFPLNPQSSKAKLMVIAAFMASLFFVTGLIVALELLDQSLKTPAVAEDKTGLEILGVLAAKVKNKSIDADLLNQKLFNLMCNQLSFSLRSNQLDKNDNPPLIFVYSSRSQTCIAKTGFMVAKALLTLYKSVNYLHAEELQGIPDEEALAGEAMDISSYSINGDDVKEKIQQLASKQKPSVVQLPEFDKQALIHFLDLSPAISVLVVSATQTWDYQDQKTLDVYKNSLPENVHRLLLTNAQPDRLDNYLAEVPRKRTFMRRWLKKIIKFNLVL